MKISLVIPAYNEEAYIGACLASVQQNGARLFEVIVIDNASTDRTLQVASGFPNVRVVPEMQKGLTKARARGLLEAKGDIIAYIDADTLMPAGWVAKIEEAYTTDPSVVCVSGPYIYHDISLLGKMFVWAYWILLAWPAYAVIGYMAVGGNFAAKKSALEQIGGFDKSIEFYGEDTDIARRLHAVGKVLFRQRLFMYTSARRLHGEGTIKTAIQYVLNFLSIVILKKPATHEYKDIR